MRAQSVTLITLAVNDLGISREFYQKLGFQEAEGGNEKIAFFKLQGQYFSLYSKAALAEDLKQSIPSPTTGSITLATNYADETQVDQAYAMAIEAGATAITQPDKVFWGGYSGTYADPDGHLWEIAFNPFWTLDDEGQLKL